MTYIGPELVLCISSIQTDENFFLKVCLTLLNSPNHFLNCQINILFFSSFQLLLAVFVSDFCHLMGYRLPGSSVHGISQARMFSGWPFPFPGHLPNPGIDPRTLYQLSHQRSPGANRLSCTLFSRFHIGVLIYSICFSDSLHSIGQSLDLSTSLQMTQFCFLLCLSNISLHTHTHTHTHTYILYIIQWK